MLITRKQLDSVCGRRTEFAATSATLVPIEVLDDVVPTSSMKRFVEAVFTSYTTRESSALILLRRFLAIQKPASCDERNEQQTVSVKPTHLSQSNEAIGGVVSGRTA